MDVKPSYIVHVCSFNFFSLVVSLALPFFRLVDLWPFVAVGLEQFEIDLDLFIAQILDVISFLLNFFFLQNGLKPIDV